MITPSVNSDRDISVKLGSMGDTIAIISGQQRWLSCLNSEKLYDRDIPSPRLELAYRLERINQAIFDCLEALLDLPLKEANAPGVKTLATNPVTFDDDPFISKHVEKAFPSGVSFGDTCHSKMPESGEGA